MGTLWALGKIALSLITLGPGGIILVLTYLFNVLLGGILYFVGWVFDWTLELSTKFDDSTLNIINIGWGLSLDIANGFFILILLAIAIATILGFESFNYKKALPILLLVALLINFSMVIGGVVIDATNVPALFFSDTIRTSGLPSELVMNAFVMGSVKKMQSDSGGLLDKLGDISGNFIDLLLMQLYETFSLIVAIFIFLSGAVYMIQRAFWLWFLLMISPFAWLALAIPGQKKYWSTWWDKFIKWCLFAPVYLFFLHLALLISKKTALISVTNSTLDTFSVTNIMQLLIVAFLMFMGITAGNSLGVAGSNFVVNYANKMKGAASKKFSDLRSKSPLSAEKLGEKFGGLGARGLAAIPGVGRVAGYRKDEVSGRLELDRQKQRQEDMEKEKLRHTGRMAGMDENQKRAYLENVTTSARSGTGTTSLEQAAAINMLMEDKEAMENLTQVEQGYLRQAVAAAKSATQRNNIAVSYVSSMKTRAADIKEATAAIKEAREKQEKAFEAYAKHLTEEEKKTQRKAEKEAEGWERYAEKLTEKDIEKTGGSRG